MKLCDYGQSQIVKFGRPPLSPLEHQLDDAFPNLTEDWLSALQRFSLTYILKEITTVCLILFSPSQHQACIRQQKCVKNNHPDLKKVELVGYF